MNTFMFIIIFSMMIIAQITIILIVRPPKLTVLAGDVSKNHLFFDLSTRSGNIIKCGSEYVDVTDKVSMIVRGNSMQKYNIFDGQTIYMELISASDVTKIKDHPVLVLRNRHNTILGCRYKLRKFVCYINDLDNVNLESLYERNSKFIDMKKELFCQKINNKIKRIKEKNGPFILSETYKEDIGMSDYSLHHAKYIYASADYVV